MTEAHTPWGQRETNSGVRAGSVCTSAALVKVQAVSHLIDHRLRVSLVDPQCYYGDIEGVVRTPRRSDILIGNEPRLAHDHTHAEPWRLLGCHRRRHLGE